MQKLKVGDTVQVIAGKERSEKTASSKRGKVIVIDREAGRLKVEGMRLVKKHIKKGASRTSPEGGIVEIPGSIDVSSVQVVCPKCDQATRVGIKAAGEKKVRFCKKCDANID